MAIHFKFSKIGPINIETTVAIVPRPRLLTVNIEVIGLQITKKDTTIGIMIITMAVIDTIITITIETFTVDEGRVSMAMKTNLIITKVSIGALVIAAITSSSTITGIRLDHLIMTTDGDTDPRKKIIKNFLLAGFEKRKKKSEKKKHIHYIYSMKISMMLTILLCCSR